MSHESWMTPRTKPLAPEEQDRLIRELRRTGDPAIERRLIEANLRLVLKIARGLDRSRGRAFDDIVQEGCLGLMEAIRRFDPAKGARLTTYAALWIRAYIMKYAMDNVRIVRAVRTRAERAAFFQGTVGSPEVSMDARRAEDGATLADLLPDAAPPPDRRLEVAELLSRVQSSGRALAPRLPPSHAQVLRQRVLAEEPAPRLLVARRMSVSGERVRQIEIQLRAMIRSQVAAAA
jgi:RNA polymerase sigma-32 factor